MNKLIVSAAAMAFAMTALPAMAQDDSAGMDLYNDNCAICHGNKGEGYDKSVVPDGAVRIKKLAGDSAYWDFAIFKQTVMDGMDDHNRPMKVMPVFGKVGLYFPEGQILTDQELQDIQDYMKTFAPQE